MGMETALSASKYTAYPEYKDSGVEWLGDIPEHWKVTRLKHMAQIKNGQDYKAVETSEGYPVLGSGGQFTYATKFLYDKESVLLGRKGTIDKPLYINEPFWTVDTMYYTEINKDVPAKYLHYLALTIQFSRYSTNTALPSMTQEHLGNYSFGVPPEWDERAQIQNFLDHETAKIDTLIEEQQSLIRLLQEKRQAVISHAVTKGLNPDAPMKNSGVEWLGQVPEHWEIMPLKYAVTFQRGHDLPANNRIAGNVPLVSSAGISSSHNVAVAKAPGLVTGRYGTIGDFTLVNKDYWPLNTTLYSIDLRGNNPKYLWYMLHNLKPIFLANSLKSAVPGVDRNDLHPVPVAITKDQDEQEQVCDYLDSICAKYDELSAEANETITLLQERRTALISAAVTGKIDVRDWQSPTPEQKQQAPEAVV